VYFVVGRDVPETIPPEIALNRISGKREFLNSDILYPAKTPDIRVQPFGSQLSTWISIQHF